MRQVFSHLKKFDWIAVIVSLLLVVMGLISLYSSSQGKGDFQNFTKQLIFFALALAAMFALSFFDWRLLKNNSYLLLFLYFMGIIALGGLLLFAPETRGVQAWYKIGPISIDPVEYMKIVMILLMAKYLSRRHSEFHQLSYIALSAVYFAIPIALISLQPNLGSASILGALWFTTVLMSGIRVPHFLGIVGVVILISIGGWNFFLEDYQKNRIVSFLEPELDPLGIGWSQHQAKIAIGNGGLWGEGIGQGTQTQYGFLSEPQTDFIFAAIAEELGFVGVAILLFLFCALLWRILKISLRAETNFPRFFAIGLAVLLGIQAGVHIGMNLGLLPIIGLSLPLVSYGGSSLIMSFAALGILQSIKTH